MKQRGASYPCVEAPARRNARPEGRPHERPSERHQAEAALQGREETRTVARGPSPRASYRRRRENPQPPPNKSITTTMMSKVVMSMIAFLQR